MIAHHAPFARLRSDLRRVCVALTFVALGSSAPATTSAFAQVVDSVSVSADTGGGDSARVVRRPPVGFDDALGPFERHDNPARLPHVELQHLLADGAGVFLYDLSTPGWPHGVSPMGLNPNHVGLVWNDMPYSGLITGRPLFDFVPLTQLSPPEVEPQRLGRPASVRVRTRSYRIAQPITELLYWTSNKGLQLVRGSHAQTRRQNLFGGPASLGFLFAYHGGAADGEYPNSGLQKGRQVLGRVRISKQSWSLDVTGLFNRRTLGAHSGAIVPIPDEFESIYLRIGAAVVDASAKRESWRNDFVAKLRARSMGNRPLSIGGFWSTERHEYRNADTLSLKADRVGGRVSQPFSLGTGGAVEVSAWVDKMRASTSLPDSVDRSSSSIFAHVVDTVSAGSLGLVLKAGVQSVDGEAGLDARVSIAWGSGSARLFADAWQTNLNPSFVERTGFGTFLAVDGPPAPATVRGARAGFSAVSGVWSATAFAFLNQTTDAFDMFATAVEDSAEVRTLSTSIERGGIAADLGFRMDSKKGLYLQAKPTWFGITNAPSSAPNSDVARWYETIPELNLTGRVGARYLLFQGDLDANLYIRARYWSNFVGREFHPQTGLLMVPLADARPVDASATVDVVLEAGVRTATIFLSYENLLAGSSAIAGNQNVTFYPLAEQRFRFGVYWPIRN